MTKQEIVLTIAPDGSMVLSVEGVCGPACQDLTRSVEAALGTVTNSVPTDEMYAEQTISTEVSQ